MWRMSWSNVGSREKFAWCLSQDVKDYQMLARKLWRGVCRWKGLQTEDQHVPSTTWEEHRELQKPKEVGMARGQRARGRAVRREGWGPDWGFWPFLHGMEKPLKRAKMRIDTIQCMFLHHLLWHCRLARVDMERLGEMIFCNYGDDSRRQSHGLFWRQIDPVTYWAHQMNPWFVFLKKWLHWSAPLLFGQGKVFS